MIDDQKTLSKVSALIDDGTLTTTLTEIAGPINAANLKRAHAPD